MKSESLAMLMAPFLAISLATSAMATEDRSGAGEARFRTIFKQVVETNTVVNEGSCTLAAQRLAVHLKKAGYSGDHLRLFTAPGHPKDGGLVARLDGTDPKAKPILFLAHLDVVAAKRADWTRDPFTLFEEDGYFYGRGVSDDKSQVAVFTDLMIRLKEEGYRPKRTLKLALTCGEETAGAFNGADWLAKNHKDWIDAEFAINEGGGGDLDAKGHLVNLGVNAAEKVAQNFLLETTNPGGHSSQPVPDNAIYDLNAALLKLSTHEFPVQFNAVTRPYFEKMSQITGGETGAAMTRLLKNPEDAQANAIVSKDKQWHSMLRTTCVATLLEAGHATNALPQRATANVNCRIFPGTSIEQIRQDLIKLIDNSKVSVTARLPLSPGTPTPALHPGMMKAILAVSEDLYPNVPVIPSMSTGASDGIYLSAAGIPTYGVDGAASDPDGGFIHGLNERIRVKTLLDDRRFHYKLIKILADQN